MGEDSLSSFFRSWSSFRPLRSALPSTRSTQRRPGHLPDQDSHGTGMEVVFHRGHRDFPAGLGDVIRALETCVDRPLPTARPALLDRESQRLMVRVDHHVEVAVALRGPEQAVREAVRVVGQVGQVADSMPPKVAAPELAASKRSMGLAERDHLLDEAEMIRMGYLARPV